VTSEPPVRIFLDTSVVIDGATRAWGWGASRVVLTLCTQRDRIAVVWAAAVEDELRTHLAHLAARHPAEVVQAITASVDGWLARIRRESWPRPTAEALRQAAPDLLPALRHVKDLPPVVSAMQARPDWTISGNARHWNAALAERTRLRIVTPREFVRRLVLA
jgi:hypothetical protein